MFIDLNEQSLCISQRQCQPGNRPLIGLGRVRRRQQEAADGSAGEARRRPARGRRPLAGEWTQ